MGGTSPPDPLSREERGTLCKVVNCWERKRPPPATRISMPFIGLLTPLSHGRGVGGEVLALGGLLLHGPAVAVGVAEEDERVPLLPAAFGHDAVHEVLDGTNLHATFD